ncbi:MAG: sulfurtransferase [Rubrivivax sp.]|nr:sulfurtransferase [Rubrivivax sp.]
MSFDTLISAEELMALRASGRPLVLLDCSFDLADPQAGERSFRAGHLPGAHHADLDRDLATPKHPDGPRSPQFTGRHPLPDRDTWARRVAGWGIRPGVQVVSYDGQGSPYAARAWWMLRWLGHAEAAVLDGGLAAWTAAGGTLQPEVPDRLRTATPYPAANVAAMPSIDAATLMSRLGRVRLLDARAIERWRGDLEPLDPVGGHIPGSTPRFFKDNLRADGRFKPREQLQAEFTGLGVRAGEPTVHQCGSGVTACHNLLAQAHAGLGLGTLYPGSWSEWCADPERPVARG